MDIHLAVVCLGDNEAGRRYERYFLQGSLHPIKNLYALAHLGVLNAQEKTQRPGADSSPAC
jgi:hypothetical protein